MKRAGPYIRVSTEEQTENYSIPAQKERLNNYCKAKDWTIVDFYIDPGYSGKNLDRPGIQKLIKDSKSGLLDVVPVYKLDRISRSQKDTLFLIEDVFLKSKVDFVSINEAFDTSTPFGRAMIGVLSVFAQLEREQITERTSMGRGERAKSGLFHGGGFIPHGYDYFDGKLVINEAAAIQINEVFDLYLQGVGCDKIQEIMHQKYKNKYADYASPSTIRNILDSPIYVGKIQWKGQLFDGQHPAIVSQEKWDAVRMIRQSKKDYHKSPFQSTSLLSGITWCGQCGSRYFMKQNTGGLRYYSCYSRAKTNLRMIKDPNCRNKNWNINDLDALIEGEMMKLALDPQYFDNVSQTQRPGRIIPDQRLAEKISSIDRQISRLMDLYQNDKMPIEEIGKRIERLYNDKKVLSAELQPNTDFDSEQKIGFAKEILAQISIAWSYATIEEKRKIISALINKIVLDDENVRIEWSFL